MIFTEASGSNKNLFNRAGFGGVKAQHPASTMHSLDLPIDLPARVNPAWTISRPLRLALAH